MKTEIIQSEEQRKKTEKQSTEHQQFVGQYQKVSLKCRLNARRKEKRDWDTKNTFEKSNGGKSPTFNET